VPMRSGCTEVVVYMPGEPPRLFPIDGAA
jgi:hypothetical protein